MKSINKAILYIISAAFFFSLMNTFVRLSGDLPSIQKSFFRNFIALIFAFVILQKQSNGISFKRENLKLLILRSALGTIGILGNFYAVDHLLLSDASMMNKLSPFLVLIFSYFFLKEKIKLYQIILIFTAFIGCLFIVKPSFSADMFPFIIGIIGAMGAGAAYTAVRALGLRGEKGPSIVFFFSAFSCLVTFPYVIFFYTPMTLKQICFLLLAGLAASGGQFSITAAYSNAPASQISIYDYSQVLFAALTGFIIFNEIPDILSIIGYIIICSAAAVMFIINKRVVQTK